MKKIIVMSLISILLIPTLQSFGQPFLTDDNYVVREFVSGFSRPTSMAFLDDNDILVLQKDNGKILLVRDSVVHDEVVDLEVSNNSERGLLGITTVGSTVYIYLTESNRDGGTPLGNRVYSYQWNGDSLSDPVLVKDLPATPGPNHDGGAMATGLNGEVFTVIGDLNRRGPLQNFATGDVDDTSVIIQLVPEERYYAIGIRNSFGLAVDPLTGNLWDTENGPSRWDEINLVHDGFNSGWRVVMGPATESDIDRLPGFRDFTYSDPEFSWERVVAPTALSFVDSEPFEEYQNSLFVGDCNTGTLYNFRLNEERTGFVFDNPALQDNVANQGDLMEELVFGRGFSCITDIDIGPDGYLYVTSLGRGVIYQITPEEIMETPNTFTLISRHDDTTYSVHGQTIGTAPSAFTILPEQSVRFDIQGNGQELDFTLPKSMINGIHTIRADMQEIPFELISSNDASSTVRFSVPANVNSIEVLGSFVVPEFGMMALLIFAGSVTAILVLGRNRYNKITI